MLSSWIISVAVLVATTFAQTNFTNLVYQLPNCTVSLLSHAFVALSTTNTLRR